MNETSVSRALQAAYLSLSNTVMLSKERRGISKRPTLAVEKLFTFRRVIEYYSVGAEYTNGVPE